MNLPLLSRSWWRDKRAKLLRWQNPLGALLLPKRHKISLFLEYWLSFVWEMRRMLVMLRLCCCFNPAAGGLKKGSVGNWGQIAQPLQSEFGTQGSNRSSASVFCSVRLSLCPKGGFPCLLSKITKNKTAHLFFTGAAWHSNPTGGVFGFVYLETKFKHLWMSGDGKCVFCLLCENNYQDKIHPHSRRTL